MASSISLAAWLQLALVLLARPAGVSRGGDAWRALVGRMGSGLWSGTCHGKSSHRIASPAIVTSAIVSYNRKYSKHNMVASTIWWAMVGHRLSGLVDAVRSQRYRGGGGVIRRVVLLVRLSDVPLAALFAC